MDNYIKILEKGIQECKLNNSFFLFLIKIDLFFASHRYLSSSWLEMKHCKCQFIFHCEVSLWSSGR